MADGPTLERLVAENESLRQRVSELERRLARFDADPESEALGRAMGEREALLAEAERMAHMGSWVWDVPADRVVWSDQLYRILGYDPAKDSASTAGFFARVHPLDVDRVHEVSRRGTESGLAETVECRVLWPDGTVRDVAMDATFLFDSSGVLQRAAGTVLDVTEYRNAREENRRIRLLLEETQRLTSTGSWELDFGTGATHWTPEMYRILGFPDSAEPSPEAFQSRVHPDDLPRYSEAREHTIRTGEVVPVFECRVVRPDGDERKIRVLSAQFRDDHDRVVGVRGTVSDVTVQSRLEEQLHQSRKMEAIGQLSGGIAHDFNNLLMVLLGGTERLRRGDDVAECLADIEAAARSAATLTQRLLAFSRKAVLAPSLVDLRRVVEEMAPLVTRTIGEHIQTRFQYPDTALVVRVDPHLLQQVLLNLAVNARDSMPNGGQLVVRLEPTQVVPDGSLELRAGRHAVVTVQDTGCGMAPETLARIFEPFFTTKEVGRGTGLGLSMVYGAMKQSGGAVTVESQEGAGTTFRLYLPTETAPLVPMQRSLTPAPRSTRVLLVEDDDAVRRAVTGMLKRAGCTTHTADGAEAALVTWSELRGEVDVLVTDVVMPGMQGDALAEKLLGEKPGLRALFITGYANRALLSDRLEGRAAVLPKPFTSKELLRALSDLLGTTSSIGHS